MEVETSRQGPLIKWQGEEESRDGCFRRFESESERKEAPFSKLQNFRGGIDVSTKPVTLDLVHLRCQ